MTPPSRQRDEHRGNPAPHLGQDHFEKSRIEGGAVGRDAGPTFAPTPDDRNHDSVGQPGDANQLARDSIEKSSPADRSNRAEELQEAVEDLDDGPAVKP